MAQLTVRVSFQVWIICLSGRAQTCHGRVHGEKGWHALRASESAPRVRVPWRMSFSAILLNPKKNYISIDSEFLFFFKKKCMMSHTDVDQFFTNAHPIY